jgi:hypothetical protein
MRRKKTRSATVRIATNIRLTKFPASLSSFNDVNTPRFAAHVRRKRSRRNIEQATKARLEICATLRSVTGDRRDAFAFTCQLEPALNS